MKNKNFHSLEMAIAMLALSAGVVNAQFSVLHSFTGGADGANPYYDAPVVSGSTLYGTANQGAAGGGVVFAVNTDGTGYAVLHTFTNAAPDGYQPLGSVVLNDSTLYGTTYYGGSANGTSGYGTVFAVNADGSGYQTLHSFTTATGYKPYGTVTVDGSTLYGMTYYGSGSGVGSIYSLNTDGGNYTTLHTFAGGTADGSKPLGGTLTLSGGVLYGTTAHGGTGSSVDTANDGVVFAINTDGSGYTNLANFTGGTTNGANPYGWVTLVGTTLYGTTRIGGTANLGTIFSVNTDGTGFQTLFNFTGGTTNGSNPNGALTWTGSCFVGTTKAGGSANDGIVFKINSDGSGFSILHSFTGTADGVNPDGDLTYTNNTLYGWTSAGGASNKGTVFALAVGGYAFGGLGITNVLTGSVANGGLFWTNIPTWLNTSPSLPYTNQVTFALPTCDQVIASRLVMTVWGGTPDYTCQMTVTVNGTNLPAANPFVFGTTTDLNAIFNADAPCAYGSGYGVWLVALPVPAGMLHTNGLANTVSVVETTPNNFDGRIQHVTLVSVYQSHTLTNNFNYALAEGSGDIYGTPTSAEVDQRTALFGAVNPTNATAATLTALYTYADAGSDGLFFNGIQLGGDDVAQWDTSVANYGPSVVSFNVLTNLVATNTVRFSVAAADLTGTPENSLRPQLAVLAVTRPITPPALAITVKTNQATLTITGDRGRTYTVLSSTNLLNWDEAGSFVSTNAVLQWGIPATNTARFFRVRAQ